MAKTNIPHEVQHCVKVHNDGQVVGDFVCDILVNHSLILELKSVSQLAVAHEVQLVNYLNATMTDVGLLINFGSTKVEVKRKYRKQLGS